MESACSCTALARVEKKNLLNMWIMAWHKFYDPSAGLDMHFVVAHGDYETKYPFTPDTLNLLRCRYPKALQEPAPFLARSPSEYQYNVIGREGHERHGSYAIRLPCWSRNVDGET